MGRRFRRVLKSKILFYALGGGYGHVCRALHIIRALLALAPQLEVLLLGPERCRHLVPHQVDFKAPHSTARAELTAWFNDCLDRFRPNLVVVDTFPRGVMGELKFVPEQTRVLVTRLVPSAFYGKPEVRKACFDFDQIFWSEGKFLAEFPGVEVEPVIDTRPLSSPPTSSPKVLGLGSGIYQHEGELKRAFTAAFGPNGRWLDSGAWVPDIGLQLSGFELLLSASGYNTFYEASRAGIPTIFVPQKRPYDFQRQRVEIALIKDPAAPFRLARLQPTADTLLVLAKELKAQRRPVRTFRGAEQIASELLGRRQTA